MENGHQKWIPRVKQHRERRVYQVKWANKTANTAKILCGGHFEFMQISHYKFLQRNDNLRFGFAESNTIYVLHDANENIPIKLRWCPIWHWRPFLIMQIFRYWLELKTGIINGFIMSNNIKKDGFMEKKEPTELVRWKYTYFVAAILNFMQISH